jgi:hypothetical protein
MDAWRNHYDSWKTGFASEPEVDEDGEPIDQDELDAQAEAAAEERAERQREDMMFDRDSQEDW